MKSKKFMLAGLVLLAITMVLLPLSGCKNDSVPETPKYRVTFDVGVNSEATAPKPITVESGATLTAEQVPALPETSSYQFLGWYLGDTKIGAGYTVRESVTVTARWQGTNLTFTAEGKQSLTIKESGMGIPDSMEYSTDGGQTWSKPQLYTAIPFGNGTKLYLRAKSSIGTAENSNAYLYFQFGTEVKVACSGDIRTLVDYTNPTGAATSQARFCYLFEDCSQLTQAPELSATTLANECYLRMFDGCTGLTQAPELPAKALADDCYMYMFNGCTGLTQPPELPAKTLADSCYLYMFNGCTGLTQAPELPAETLDNECYANMFRGCTSLTQAPKLPAKALTDSCYYGMFDGCTGLTQAPKLPATALADECYSAMFDGCTSLTVAPELEATALAPKCYEAMFIRCTGLTQAPELPATALADECYADMFYGCTSLTVAPELEATSLVYRCYYRMFSGCEELRSVTMLAADVDSSGALDQWLDGTAEGGTLYVASGMETNKKITGSLPTGKNWTVEVAATN